MFLTLFISFLSVVSAQDSVLQCQNTMSQIREIHEQQLNITAYKTEYATENETFIEGKEKISLRDLLAQRDAWIAKHPHIEKTNPS